jgi:P4 family phage/plasmid primase-like protien
MNAITMNPSQFKDLSEFLSKHIAKATETTDDDGNIFRSAPNSHTHTRIPDKDLNIYGGAYIIPQESLKEFYSLYYDYVFVKKKKEYLTEKQVEKKNALLVDFDFRYSYDVETRQHTKENILDMILLYLEELKEFFLFEENKPFDIFIFEKPNVNRLADKSLTKDGIHMMICIEVDHVMQLMLREKLLDKLQEAWELPLLNNWESVLDEGISKGKTNWQLFGSRKPGNEAYELTNHFILTFDKNDGEFMMDEMKVEDFDMKNNFYKLSAQNANIPSFELNPKIIDKYNQRLQLKNSKVKKPTSTSKVKMNLIVDGDQNDCDDDEYISINDITNKETLNKAMELILKRLKPTEYEIKETHMYTQILPEKYYEPGSHLLNRQVAFALKHTDERLFLSWIMLRSKASDFDYSTIPSLYNDWKKYFNTSKTGVTRKSIMYWAKQDAFEEYEKVLESTVDYFIEETLESQTEFDIAQVLHQKYKDRYVCVSYDKKGIWFVFKNHRWEPDRGLSLRLAISKDIHNLYSIRRTNLENEYHHFEQTDDRADYLKKKLKALSDIMQKLKRTNDKNNIMREAMELFYDKEFIKNMDTNKHLLCFNNGVIDFNTKEFRDGYPQDYITKTTRINYEKFTPESYPEIVAQIHDFMDKLFPIPDLNKYMWNHLASCLIGTNKNQTFNVYHGSGSNGKSMLTDLMTHALGDYKGTVPITLVTKDRNAIGGTSSEVMQLKGIRYAVMQEPSKGVKLNEGIMKELTGGDPIQGRALYCESETFQPQFKLVVCTNNLFDIESNDDGTWRRIRKCNFVSKFKGEDEEHTDDTPYIFMKDKSLETKLPVFAPVFASMLVNIAFDTEGNVPDCEYVMNASNKYRIGQDHIAAFVSENLIKTGDMKHRIKKQELANHFKYWFTQEQGSNKKIPKGEELYMYMDKKFGSQKPTGWHGVKILYPDDNIDQIDDL